MPAPTTQQSGYSYLVQKDITGTLTTIGGGTGATLNLNTTLAEATNKGSSRWKKTVCGTRSWSVDFEGMYLVSAAELCGSGMSFLIGAVAIKGLKQMDIALSADMFESVNSTTGLDRQLVPGNRTMTVTLSGEWYDFDLDTTPTAGDETLEDIFDAWYANTTVSGIITISGVQAFAATTFRVTNAQLTFPHDGIIGYNVTLEATGAPGTLTQTSADAVLITVFSDFLNASGVQSDTIRLWSAQYGVQWSGTAYPETLNISIPYDGVITVSGTYAGSGALTQAVGAAS